MKSELEQRIRPSTSANTRRIRTVAKALGYNRHYRERASGEPTQNGPMGTSTDIFRPYSYIWTPISSIRPTNDDSTAPRTLSLGQRRRIDADDQSSLGSPSKRQKAYDENQELRMGKKRGIEGGHDDGGFLKYRSSTRTRVMGSVSRHLKTIPTKQRL